MSNVYIIVGLIIFLCILYSFFNSVVKSIKLLFSKEIYKIDKDYKVRDIIEITIILILLLSIFATIITIFLPKDNCRDKYGYPYYPIQTRKSVSLINTAFSLEYASNKKFPINEDEFLKFFQNRAAWKEIYNIKENSSTEIKRINKKYIKSEKNKNGIDKELADKPCFFESIGTLYFINRYQNSCKNVDLENPEKSDCYMTIDLNGFDQPNTLMNFDKESKYVHFEGDQIIVVIQQPQAEEKEEEKPISFALLPVQYLKLLKS